MRTTEQQLSSLAAEVVRVLDQRCKAGRLAAAMPRRISDVGRFREWQRRRSRLRNRGTYQTGKTHSFH